MVARPVVDRSPIVLSGDPIVKPINTQRRHVRLAEHRRGFDFDLFGLRHAQVLCASKPMRRNHISSGTVTSGGTAASSARVHAHQGQRRRMADNSVTTT